jgi:NAD(P)-dependent dehydrogenase (short-subunit alcohol dehydrogenase family)
MALDLADRGFDVWGGVRNADDGEALAEASGRRVRPIALEVTSAPDREAAGAALEEATGDRGLWGLVNNAGIFHMGPLETITPADFRRSFEVNLFAPFALTNRLLPLLRKARGRVVNISSINAFTPFPLCGVYNATKAALDAMSDTLRLELIPWGMGVSVVQPGVTATDIRQNGIAGWGRRRESMSAESAALYQSIYEKTVPLLDAMEEGAAGHDDVNLAVADALTSDEPKSTYLAGPDTADIAALAALPPKERDAALLAMWD